jgi:hypothetical protein
MPNFGRSSKFKGKSAAAIGTELIWCSPPTKFHELVTMGVTG